MSPSTVGSAADCNNDDTVDWADLLGLTEKWLNEGGLLAADINRDGIVDFFDYAVFAPYLH